MSTSKMTSRERVLAAVTMQGLPDQLPVTPLLMTRGIREGGVKVNEVLLDGVAMAKAKIKAHQKFGGDVLLAGTDLFTPVENLGAVLDYLPYAQPSLVTHPAPTKEAFYRLKGNYLSKGFDPEKGRLRAIQEEIRTFIKEGWKDTHALATPVGGPITTAQLVTGTDEFFSYLADDPDYAKEVIELSLDVCKNICRMMFEAGIDVCNILDPFCSSDVLPPEIYREFGLPYQKRLFEYIQEIGGIGFTHICTFTQPIWSDIASNGCINFNGDMYPGANLTKRAIGDKISLMGTLSPYSTLTHGTPEDVAKEVKKLAVEVGYNGGFICMPGCDIDWTVPEENMRALIDTCASIKYPIDIEALGDLSDVYLAGQPKHSGMRKISTENDQQVRMGINKTQTQKTPEAEILFKLADAITEYDGDKVVELTNKGLELGITPQQIIFDGLSLGMKMVGDLYERNERFITDMLKSAKTMEKAMPILIPLLEASGAGAGEGNKETVVMGLIRGNTQDIGKNLVVLMLKANGFKVIDLGKNVTPEQFIEAAEANNAVAIGISVMTNSSVNYAEKVTKMLNEQGKSDKYLVMTGGAAMNEKIAEQIGTKYGSDANAAVSLVRNRIAATA
ncbi:MtaA/CmuA family methyltransferase [Desulfosporosinus metallidurans]|uniref:5-methyltetrahydrofolate--homocysteine methyltransferase n=1 Tax=Desulfosporosinus metallidurans TaxID=1888891 RepID=A0A1Q8QJF5_9FIRM|nr:MtaA/CmuA family methyltransferase [Desulfosporosinus metallidurans]OLN27388.1 5-methyltetrahydrofolate--homocysteine methyltransferase [Desulfosporosinus metallidurans]